MKKSVLNRLVLMALVAVGTVFVSGVGPALAQRQANQRAQYEVDVPPPVEVPSAATEADLFQPKGEFVSPGDDYADSVYGEGMVEPTPLSQEMAYGPNEFTATGAGPYDGFGQTCDTPAPIYSTGSWWWRGRWYTQMDVVVMDRDDHRVVPLLVAANGLQNVSDLARLHYEAGTRLTLGRFLGRDAASRDHLVEFSFLGLFDFEDGRRLEDQADPGMGTITTALSSDQLNDFNTNFVNSDAQSLFYESDFNDFQFNYRLQTRPGKDVLALQPDGMWVRHAVSSQVRSVFAGMRVSSINEQIDYSAEQFGQIARVDVLDGLDGSISQQGVVTADDAERGRYLVRTNNDMFGLHIGGELTEKYDSWSWGLKGRIGGLVNLISRRSLITSRLRDQVDGDPIEVQRRNDNNEPLFIDDDGMATTDPENEFGMPNDPLIDTLTPVTFQARDLAMGEKVTDNRFTWVAEAGVFGKYQFRPNLAVRAGYDVMLYSNLALAPENLGLADGFTQISVSGTAVYHGGFAGFETTW